MHPLMMATVSIGMSVAAQFALKAGMSSVAVKAAMAQPLDFSTGLTLLTQPWVMAGFALYGLGAVVWLSVLSHWDVSKAYPLVGLGFAFTVLIGFVIGENVTPQRACGVMLICAGVWIVAQT
jgi:multidrug transporter EmrE-like cation transporter